MNIFQIAAAREYAWKQNVMGMSGYEPFTTFYSDFTLAELVSGEKGVKDTFGRCFRAWKTDYKYLTELVMVLNHKIWEHYEKNESMARCYNDLWINLDSWCCENLSGEAAEYYYRVLD